jgi:hypothetical protein
LKIRLNWKGMQKWFEIYFTVKRESITLFNIMTHILLKIM